MGALNIFRLLGDLVHVISIFLLASKIMSSRSCKGISLKSQILYLTVYVVRYLDFFAMLKMDVLHMYNSLLKIVFIASQSLIIYLMHVRFVSTFDKRTDSFKRNWIYLILGICFVISFFATNCRSTWSFTLKIREVSDLIVIGYI